MSGIYGVIVIVGCLISVGCALGWKKHGLLYAIPFGYAVVSDIAMRWLLHWEYDVIAIVFFVVMYYLIGWLGARGIG